MCCGSAGSGGRARLGDQREEVVSEEEEETKREQYGGGRRVVPGARVRIRLQFHENTPPDHLVIRKYIRVSKRVHCSRQPHSSTH